jgi:hypothetical protein
LAGSITHFFVLLPTSQCNRGFGYLDAVRAHMRDKNHVILDVESCAEEVEEYYNLDDDGWEDEVTCFIWPFCHPFPPDTLAG